MSVRNVKTPKRTSSYEQSELFAAVKTAIQTGDHTATMSRQRMNLEHLQSVLLILQPTVANQSIEGG